jgi:Ca2+-binding EF-hand superfamily protein
MSDGTTIPKGNALSSMLDKAFLKFDKNGDGKLDQSEFAGFNEILKPGNALDDNGKPKTDYSKLMDKNGDGSITQDEMDHTGVLMPASLTSDNFANMVSYLKAEGTTASLDAAALLFDDNSDAGK